MDGSVYNCLSESLLELLLHHKMIRTPNALENNIAASEAEACDAVRTYVGSHEDERAWPLQRD